MKKKQFGFSAVEGLLIVIVIAGLVVLGWLAWQRVQSGKTNERQTSTTSNNSADKIVEREVKKNTIADAPKPGWKIYTNNTVGFSIQFPSRVYSGYGAACAKTASSYRPAGGLVSTTVVEDAPSFYIAPSFTYQLTGMTSAGDGTYNFSGCQKLTTNVAAINASNAQSDPEDNPPLIEQLAFQVAEAENDAAILTEVRRIFDNDRTITIKSIKDSAEGDWQDITPDSPKCDEVMTCPYGGGRFMLRYYPDAKLVAYFSLGQTYNLVGDQDYATQYDDDVVNSFKPL